MIIQVCMKQIKESGEALLWPKITFAQGHHFAVCAHTTSCVYPDITALTGFLSFSVLLIPVRSLGLSGS
jgi:hypothetical protein